ncbi:MAG TPA: helix-turn-helix transcriptional regulator [Pyrinomonadaceae bacterium]|jgi:transcriptional regulator with XRE-family HTH domain|nr:helix-turn-helix transcriptional regulator [Pyrinomonadaceae bacterium]
MGRAPRPKPERLPEKLLQIRLALGLSQNEILVRLGLGEKLYRTAVSGYELGTSEPPLPVILTYARLAGICTDVLLDDDLNLPDKLPSKPEHH